jgi:hypothetical protein
MLKMMFDQKRCNIPKIPKEYAFSLAELERWRSREIGIGVPLFLRLRKCNPKPKNNFDR